ncbi:trypsin-like peptidase domain-containing protein [Solirubrobacter sp. CPCC 204708]|uniref:Trypsin-like peptidase domain-containing protein n=1 Tax=Solirubrobacter deserti TaxID=2282478 RepID=A0ABT4RQP0_9ACTN|nr:trypsin-like peptidase domain-containing protein [Solirubrobacter deserti]MBE2319394.1 trypsin-like peptidase domain-containing protein [Solirubrobacter deserti]MDA0140891.1 trypsin-like peptidase domain-containing protein [Solirubrobacter deserti]
MTPTDTHKLLVTDGNAKGREIVVGRGEFLIGRLADDDDGRLADDPELSRRHARIQATPDGGLEIQDLGSTNGTYVNNERVTTRRRLQPGDMIEVGQTKLSLLDPLGRSAQPTQFGRVRQQDTPRTPLAVPATPAAAAKQPTVPSRAVPRGALIGGGVVAGLAVVGVAVALAAGGGDDGEAVKSPVEPKKLTVAQQIKKGAPSTVELTTRGPGFNRGRKTTLSGGGSGIVVDAEKGLVLTNAHVVAGQTSIKAKVGGGTEMSARVVSQAPCEDLALVSLRPTPKNLVEAQLGTSSKVAAGDRVIALGYPSAFEERVSDRTLQASEGIVSAPTGKSTLGKASPSLPEVIQHQAPLNGGNSGGPLFNEAGQVIGVNTFTSGRGGSQNQNAAIGIDRVKTLLADLTAGKNSGFVGWQLLPMTGGQLPLRPRTTGRTGSALVVLSVDAGSPADKKKFEFGDTIYEIDGTPVRKFQDVCDILNSKSSGDTIRVEGYRFPPLALYGARLNSLQSAIVRQGLHFKRTIKLR